MKRDALMEFNRCSVRSALARSAIIKVAVNVWLGMKSSSLVLLHFAQLPDDATARQCPKLYLIRTRSVLHLEIYLRFSLLRVKATIAIANGQITSCQHKQPLAEALRLPKPLAD